MNAFRSDVDASLWNLPAARYVGAAINAVGVLGSGVAVAAWIRWRRGASA